MKLLYRLGFYFFGFFVGIILLSVIFKGKKTSCNYGPNDRVISNLLKKRWDSSLLYNVTFDSISFHEFLEMARVDFSKSDTTKDSCKVYYLDGYWNEKPVYLGVENCEKKVNLIHFSQKSE